MNEKCVTALKIVFAEVFVNIPYEIINFSSLHGNA